ncbi:DUF5629 family protein [Pseudomonas sp. 5P_3.1_Bac2]|uniref:DUF5629 family protein n=1 Tax=Pseudomonas sp. 5P_3.1_Bac2 TaxID=2971617 RepID=UPI0021C758AC|nr:DUF5629 family protein [Pseudomonas sp. 5P_3.1_Bac2]MCU1715580.1 DUF5629 family protein [Pseudomonas sp. 5P_3.1_Bac2]
MSTAPADLLSALNGADMLIIDNLHAWQFSLDDQHLNIECMDGRNLRKWQFSLAQVAAATYQEASDSWNIHSNDASHSLQCLGAVSGNNDDEDEVEDAANDAQ